MKGLLIRVGADQTGVGGGWNAPIDPNTREFIYGAIPECDHPVHEGCTRTHLRELLPILDRAPFKGSKLPPCKPMHLDPDFRYLSYGDCGQRGTRIMKTLKHGDVIAFYAGLENAHAHGKLIYAIIGLYVVDRIQPASEVPDDHRCKNAHTRRRKTETDKTEIVVWARPGLSGRLKQAIPIGDYRDGAYRVYKHLLEAWGHLSIRDGYIQRSVYLPAFSKASRFYRWFLEQKPEFLTVNNP